LKKKLIFIIVIASLMLISCSAKATPTALPTVALDAPADGSTSSGGSVVASGFVVAENKANLGFILSGLLTNVNVQEGDQVKEGQILAELDGNSLVFELQKAETNLAELTSPGAKALAESDLAQATKLVEDTTDDLESLNYPRANDVRIDNTQANIDLAEKAVTYAHNRWKQVSRLEPGDEKRAAALLDLTNAQIALDALVAKMNWYTTNPTGADAMIIQADYDKAITAEQEAKWYLAELNGESVPAEATGTKLNQLRNARIQVASLKDQLDNHKIMSPFDGVVAKAVAHVGEIVSPGQILFIVSNPEKLYVETTDLSEKDISQVAVGQKVNVIIKALGANVLGTVISISPVADLLGGDVVYRTRVSFDELPAGVLSGMSVDVEYIVE
jgi:multidrug efflux pump subunit AcrA (membrane-fusion protein)